MSTPTIAGQPAGETTDAPAAHERDSRPAHWSAVYAMTLCVFALVASEFMPVSLLTPIAVDLQVSEGMAGQAIAISGAFAVLTSLSILILAGKIPRKKLLLGLTGLMCLSGAVISLAPSYPIYMAGRALIGIAIGGFWSLSAAVAIGLVPTPQVPRALAIFNSGNALATVVAAPLGSFLGSVIGWRGTFFCLVPVAIVAGIWQWRSLPSLPQATPLTTKSKNVLSLLKSPFVACGMAAVSVFFMGQFALYTYVRPFLETVTGMAANTLSLTLLVIGAAGFAGTLLIGRFLQKGFYATLVVIPILMAFCAAGLMLFGHSVTAVVVLLGCWGLVATAAPVGWWSWIANNLPDDAEAGGGLMVAVVQLAIGLGSTLGGLLFDLKGHTATFALSIGLLSAAAVLAALTSKLRKPASRKAGDPDGACQIA